MSINKTQTKRKSTLTSGQRMADNLAGLMGSWRFIIWQSVIVLVWVTLNLVAFTFHWDPYPFILLNLLFSTQAAYAAPIIMMAQNRQAERDRAQAQRDLQTDLRAKKEIEDLQRAIDRIEKGQLKQILELLKKQK